MTQFEDNPSPYLTFDEQAGTPSTPAAGLALFYRKTDNKWYFLDDGGSETEVGAAVAAAYILQTLADAKGDIIGASAADTWAKLTVGANDFVLTADSGEATGLKWAAAAGGGDITVDPEFDAKGDVIGGTGNDTASRLAVGANDTVLTADSGEATGLKWAAAGGGGGGDGVGGALYLYENYS